MLKFTFSQEDLEKALKDDLLLRHMAHDMWFALTVCRGASETDETIPGRANAGAIDWKRWPQSASKDS
jgi:hypothetical protein